MIVPSRQAGRLRIGSDGTVVGNVYDKYHTSNPVAAFLFRRFLATIRQLAAAVPAERMLEVGCGEGRLAKLLAEWRPGCRVTGVDLEIDLVEGSELPRFDFCVQSAYNLGFAEMEFDLVVAAEVLEHLDHPDRGLAEIVRVSRSHVLLSVPREPLWRTLNLLRGAYWTDWGNTPGHLQHFSGAGFVEWVSHRLEVVKVARPIPWTVVLARRANRSGSD